MPCGNYIYHLLQHYKSVHFDHKVLLCVLYGSYTKQHKCPVFLMGMDSVLSNVVDYVLCNHQINARLQ